MTPAEHAARLRAVATELEGITTAAEPHIFRLGFTMKGAAELAGFDSEGMEGVESNIRNSAGWIVISERLVVLMRQLADGLERTERN